MPLTGTLFSGYQDRGWLFSKVLAIGISGYLTWLLVTLGILKFTAASCLGVTFVCVAGNGLLAFYLDKKKRYVLPDNQGDTGDMMSNRSESEGGSLVLSLFRYSSGRVCCLKFYVMGGEASTL